jgi:hypothetical protein
MKLFWNLKKFKSDNISDFDCGIPAAGDKLGQADTHDRG